MIYIGIDPGVSGGVAVIVGREIVTRAFSTLTDRDVIDLLEGYNPSVFQAWGGSHAVIERVNAGVFTIGRRMGVVSAFTFGKSYGKLLMALTAAHIPFDEVQPVKWQTVMGCRSRGDKNVTKARAQQLFPQLKVTHAIADALLIAEFCRRTHADASLEATITRARKGA